MSFTVPSNKCGVIIGRGGETIKQINQQSGAHCELDRRSGGNATEKTFIIRGEMDSVEAAKRIISDKVRNIRYLYVQDQFYCTAVDSTKFPSSLQDTFA